jgi:hypothetical protein
MNQPITSPTVGYTPTPKKKEKKKKEKLAKYPDISNSTPVIQNL